MNFVTIKNGVIEPIQERKQLYYKALTQSINLLDINRPLEDDEYFHLYVDKQYIQENIGIKIYAELAENYNNGFDITFSFNKEKTNDTNNNAGGAKNAICSLSWHWNGAGELDTGGSSTDTLEIKSNDELKILNFEGLFFRNNIIYKTNFNTYDWNSTPKGEKEPNKWHSHRPYHRYDETQYNEGFYINVGQGNQHFNKKIIKLKIDLVYYKYIPKTD